MRRRPQKPTPNPKHPENVQAVECFGGPRDGETMLVNVSNPVYQEIMEAGGRYDLMPGVRMGWARVPWGYYWRRLL